jgi:hypothetical protein
MNDPQQIIVNALLENPDISIVLEISKRARELEQMQPAKNFGIGSETLSSQCLAQQVIQS